MCERFLSNFSAKVEAWVAFMFKVSAGVGWFTLGYLVFFSSSFFMKVLSSFDGFFFYANFEG